MTGGIPKDPNATSPFTRFGVRPEQGYPPMAESPACCTLPPDDAPIEAAGYAAYNAGGDPATAGLNYAGKPCPEWDQLPENVRAKWKTARQEMARRIIAHLQNRILVDFSIDPAAIAEVTED